MIRHGAAVAGYIIPEIREIHLRTNRYIKLEIYASSEFCAGIGFVYISVCRQEYSRYTEFLIVHVLEIVDFPGFKSTPCAAAAAECGRKIKYRCVAVVRNQSGACGGVAHAESEFYNARCVLRQIPYQLAYRNIVCGSAACAYGKHLSAVNLLAVQYTIVFQEIVCAPLLGIIRQIVVLMAE